MTNDNELRDTLNMANGIALICSLIECPNCKKDIWVTIGQHCGFDGVLDYKVESDCYQCCESFSVILDNEKQKEHKFMTIEQMTEIEFEGYTKNCSI
jgi:hypothetical protein